jgi:hypothetical protein
MKFIKAHPISSMLLGSLIFYVIIIVLGTVAYGSIFIQDFATNWLATFMGIVIGVPLAFWANEHQERITEKERKTKILKSLYDELEYSKIEFDNLKDTETIKLESGVLSSLLRDEIWNAFSDGGELQWIKDIVLLSIIADAYSTIRSVSNLADRWYDTMQYTTVQSSGERMVEVFNYLVEAIHNSQRSVGNTMLVIREMYPDVGKISY